MATLFQYGFTVASVLLVIAPFLFIAKKYKPPQWRHIIVAYILSWFLYIFIYTCTISITKSSGYYYSDLFFDGLIGATLFSIILYGLAPLLTVRDLSKKASIIKIVFLLILGVFISGTLFIIWGYFIAWGLGQIGAKYL